MARPRKQPTRQALTPPFGGPRGYCKEGHPIANLRRSTPGDLSSVKLRPEEKELLERQALEIFTLMANDGRSFADALAAILLTGLQWGSAIGAPRKPDYIHI